MNLRATCKTCGHQERLPEGADNMRPGRGYERRCKGKCRGTTWQFIEVLPELSGGRGRRA